jgi:hypothetical protein
MEEVLSLKIGSSKKKVKITHVEMIDAGTATTDKRFRMHTISDDGMAYKINEIWIRDHTKKIAVKGLWVNYDYTNNELQSTSLLARFLRFMGVSDTKELIGKEVTVEPKENGFMAIVAYDEAIP